MKIKLLTCAFKINSNLKLIVDSYYDQVVFKSGF